MSTLTLAKSCQTQLQELANRYDIPGFSCGLFFPGQSGFQSLIYNFGVCNAATGPLVSHDTRFGIGSLSKPITTYLIANALHEMSITTGFDTLLQQFDQKKGFKDITLRQAFSHSCGLPPTKPLLHFLTQGNLAHRAEQLMDRLRKIATCRHAGPSTFEYSNPLFAAAAYLVARAWSQNEGYCITIDQSFERLTRKHLTELGMQRTEPFGALGHSDASGHEIDMTNNTLLSLPWQTENWIQTASPAGGFLATVEDLLTFLQHAYLNASTHVPSLMQECFAPVIRRSKDSHYGLGWVVQQHTWGPKTLFTELFHFGGIRGYTSRMGFYPKQQCGYVILCNKGKASEFVENAKRHLQMALFALSGSARLSIAGRYTNPWLGSFLITLQGIAVIFEREPGSEKWLLEVDSDNPYRYRFQSGPWVDSGGARYIEFNSYLDACILMYDDPFFFERDAQQGI